MRTRFDTALWSEPVSSLICFAEDESEGEPSGDDTEREPSEDEGDETESDDAADTPTTYTEDEVKAKINDAIKKRLKRERRKWQREAAQRQESRSEPTNETRSESQSDWRDAWTDAIEDADVELSKKQRRKLRTMFRKAWDAGEVDDPDEWIEEWVDDFGLGSKTDNPNKTDRDVTPSGKPKSDNGAPRPIQDFDSLTDPNQLTADDVRRLETKMGKVKAWNHIRKIVENHYRDRPVVTHG